MVEGTNWLCWPGACLIRHFDSGEFDVWELEGHGEGYLGGFEDGGGVLVCYAVGE